MVQETSAVLGKLSGRNIICEPRSTHVPELFPRFRSGIIVLDPAKTIKSRKIKILFLALGLCMNYKMTVGTVDSSF